MELCDDIYVNIIRHINSGSAFKACRRVCKLWKRWVDELHPMGNIVFANNLLNILNIVDTNTSRKMAEFRPHMAGRVPKYFKNVETSLNMRGHVTKEYFIHHPGSAEWNISESYCILQPGDITEHNIGECVLAVIHDNGNNVQMSLLDRIPRSRFDALIHHESVGPAFAVYYMRRFNLFVRAKYITDEYVMAVPESSLDLIICIRGFDRVRHLKMRPELAGKMYIPDMEVLENPAHPDFREHLEHLYDGYVDSSLAYSDYHLLDLAPDDMLVSWFVGIRKNVPPVPSIRRRIGAYMVNLVETGLKYDTYTLVIAAELPQFYMFVHPNMHRGWGTREDMNWVWFKAIIDAGVKEPQKLLHSYVISEHTYK